MGRGGLLLVCWVDVIIFLEWSSPKYDGLELVEWSHKVEWSFQSGAAFGGVECFQTGPICQGGVWFMGNEGWERETIE